MLKNIQKAETMISKVLIPVTDRGWEHMMAIHKTQMQIMLEMPVFKNIVLQYMMIALAFCKDIQESKTWAVVEKFINFIVRGWETVMEIIGVDKKDPEKLLWKLFPRTMVEFEKMNSLIGDTAMKTMEIQEKLMEDETFKMHIDAISKIMEEYNPIFKSLDEEDEESVDPLSGYKSLKINKELHAAMFSKCNS